MICDEIDVYCDELYELKNTDTLTSIVVMNILYIILMGVWLIYDEINVFIKSVGLEATRQIKWIV
jgi:uncharacterized membrane protein YccF (DUF307 family)